MNNQSPFVPQGSLMEQKKQGRARVKLAVFCVLAVQGVGLLALLMQGCRRDDKDTQAAADITNTNVSAPVFESAAPVVADTNTIPGNTTTTANATTPPATPAVPSVPAAATEYVVKPGDNFTTIGKNFHVSASAIIAANPGIEPTKLKPNQKLTIPAPVAATTPTPTPAVNAGEAATADGSYKVKTGDTLIKIASSHHTTVRALRAANNLRTDNIKVGQTLKIPAASSSTTVATSPSNPAI